MKICVFSDIHANGPAFTECYKMILSEKASINLFLGDLCGYYFDALEVFEKLVQLPDLIALRGNHDEMFLRVAGGDEQLRKFYLEKYGSSFEHLLAKDYHSLVKWLKQRSCSYLSESFGFAAHHGSPNDPAEGYVYPDSDLESFQDITFQYIFLGHTHYPMVKSIGEKLIVNPGSLGQPRHGGGPTYAVVDLERRTAVFREVPYDKSLLFRKIEEAGDQPAYLKNVLLRETSSEK